MPGKELCFGNEFHQIGMLILFWQLPSEPDKMKRSVVVRPKLGAQNAGRCFPAALERGEELWQRVGGVGGFRGLFLQTIPSWRDWSLPHQSYPIRSLNNLELP